MPTGISRSLFTRKFADALGLKIQALRDIFNKNGYPAPYTDVHKALRILRDSGRDIGKCLKAVNMRPEDIQPEPGGKALPAASTALALTASPAPLNGSDQALVPAASSFSNSPLIIRLARATPGGDTPVNQRMIREIFHGRNFDLRCRNETQAVSILREAGVVITNFEYSPRHQSDDREDEKQDIDSLNLAQLRMFAHGLGREVRERDVKIMELSLRFNKTRSLVDLAGKRTMQAIKNGVRVKPTRGEVAILDAWTADDDRHPEDT